MLILSEPSPQAEIVIKKSRFISQLLPVATVEEARETLRTEKEKWALVGINHLVHAFIVGPGANVMGCSDDGEPSGTAGRPVLEVAKGTGATNFILTVARYFGGIKLGTGGLVKAYTESAQAACALAKTTELVPMTDWSIQCPYAAYERIKGVLLACEAEIQKEDFGPLVALAGNMREACFETAAAQCRDLTRGQCLLQKPEET